ncbi:hypothetical protein DUNSADRAFT_10106 [Dunaliella salina]|uniref:Uncharacterized protein n=1 Tax=Dunaliella salina TaxID=3046 RepID=A0ABQ7H500_DUNSA|nr:hypothetical protein DUNSADRAFT_10106 [Dunaliella salina]|eukprot:KAF5841935.1 hypothetical protein DUNSADRAFT_10106 [Dunaliella salina]
MFSPSREGSTPPNEPETPGSIGTSIHKADALTAELRRLQEHVESLDACQVKANMAALNDAAERITHKLQGALGRMGHQEAATGAAGPAGAGSMAQQQQQQQQRQRVTQMSADVVDTNPYSRLMALQRMGVVKLCVCVCVCVCV